MKKKIYISKPVLKVLLILYKLYSFLTRNYHLLTNFLLEYCILNFKYCYTSLSLNIGRK
jgi:hypothetical protein